jgi:hypothetical protein
MAEVKLGRVKGCGCLVGRRRVTHAEEPRAQTRRPRVQQQ